MEWINDLHGKTVGLDAEHAAQLRAVHNIRTPDAIQISAALEAGATHFFTNDIRLPDIPSIQILSRPCRRKKLLPEMNGRDLAGQITALYPGIRLLFMSGYTADIIAHQGVLDKGVAFIQKPFSMADMTEKVRELLDMASDKTQG